MYSVLKLVELQFDACISAAGRCFFKGVEIHEVNSAFELAE